MAKNKVANLHLEEFLPYRLSYLTNVIGNGLAGLYTDQFGIAHNEWRVMAVLGMFSNVSASFVAEKTAMDKVATSRAINNMIKNNLISRNFSDDDKRRSELKLSKLGQETYEKIVPLVQKYEKQLLATLSQTEMGHLDIILKKLTKHVDDLK